MLKPLRVLLVEDSADDELLLRRLLRGHYALTLLRVESENGLRAQMPPHGWDVVISDYKLPGFDGMDVLRIVRAADQDIPFILMSGTVGEETAVEAMRSGASDYIMKDKSSRLAPAIERELRQARERRARRELSEAMRYYATHDALTGLTNRHQFEQRLKELLGCAKKEGRTHVLMYMDLDQFKVINDTHGHIVGDALLREIGSLMGAWIRPGVDLLARLGGDEFGVLLPDSSIEQGLKIADDLRNAIGQFRFKRDHQIFTIGVSIGIVAIDRSSENATSLFSAADRACYAAKTRGRNQIQLYQADNRELERQREEMDWALLIPEALRRGSFHLFYQPIVPLGSRHGKAGGEILLRMEDRNGMLVSPGIFIPAAERYDLMSEVDRWVLSSVLRWVETHGAALDPAHSLSINISGRSLGDRKFLDFVLEQLAASSLDPRRLCFEITETAAIGKFGDALEFIAALRAKGCRFALDDFGSGMCSFNYLRNLPVDYLKIDGSFVKDAAIDPVARSIVEAAHHIAHAIGMETIAEFVADRAILEVLKEIGVDYAQGYCIAPPGPLDEMAVHGFPTAEICV